MSPPAPPADDDPPPGVAAILDDGRADADALLAAAVRRQQQRGCRVRGLLMTYPLGKAACGPMVLVDLHTGEQFGVSQELGAGSVACRADPQGFARASRVLREAAAGDTQLAVSNRFGGLEAAGGGFVAELLALMAAGTPVLTVVAPRHLPDWARFTGGAAVLPADAAAIDDWLAQALQHA